MADTTVPETTTVEQPALAPEPLCADEDPHVDWAARVEYLREMIHSHGDIGGEDDFTIGLAPRILALQELIATTPARTAIGFAEQIWLALDDVGSGLPISENAEAGLSLAFNTLYESGEALV